MEATDAAAVEPTPIVIAPSAPVAAAPSELRKYVIADAQGRIFVAGTVPNDSTALAPVLLGGRTVFGAGSADSDYVTAADEIAARPSNPAVLDGLVLGSLPVPCEIVVDGEAYQCADADCELEFENPGTYVVTVRAFPCLDKTFNVEVKANEAAAQS
ncbi:hypothetical protein [Burkholderia sp. 22PA0106]|uniref:hypothetical protein n=1 Tax=Burkholderia sp. 22PA0106 TaxID=3237371 RepID=UPI0039C4C7E5